MLPFAGLVMIGMVLWWGGVWHPGHLVEGRGAPESGSPEVAVRARTEQAPAPPGSASSPGRISIQVASFRTQRRAEQVLAQVSERTGLPGVVLPAQVDGRRWQRILLGAFSSVSEARKAAEPLLEDGTISEILVRPIPERWIPALTGGASP
jgi:cell division protein FtsN